MSRVNKLSAKAAADDLAAFAAQLRQRIEAEVSGFSPDPLERARRVARAMDDFDFFVNTYFPHYIRSPHKSELHKYLFTRLPEIIRSEKGSTRGARSIHEHNIFPADRPARIRKDRQQPGPTEG